MLLLGKLRGMNLSQAEVKRETQKVSSFYHYHPVIQEHGLDAILVPFVCNLNTLSSQGFMVTLDGTHVHLKEVCYVF